MSTAIGEETVEWLTAEESHDLFDERARALVGMSRIEFIEALDRGDLAGLEETPGYRELLVMLTMALVP